MSPLPVILSDEEVLKLMEVANALRTAKKPDTRPYLLLALLMETGIKKGECLAITRNHIDLEAPDGPILFVRYASPSSRYKERKIALSNDWVAAYQEYLAQYNPADHIFPWSPRRLEYLLEDLGRSRRVGKTSLLRYVPLDLRAG